VPPLKRFRGTASAWTTPAKSLVCGGSECTCSSEGGSSPGRLQQVVVLDDKPHSLCEATSVLGWRSGRVGVAEVVEDGKAARGKPRAGHRGTNPCEAATPLSLGARTLRRQHGGAPSMCRPHALVVQPVGKQRHGGWLGGTGRGLWSPFPSPAAPCPSMLTGDEVACPVGHHPPRWEAPSHHQRQCSLHRIPRRQRRRRSTGASGVAGGRHPPASLWRIV